MSQPAIFGRFVLLGPAGSVGPADGVRAYRALDLDRDEDAPVVGLRRWPNLTAGGPSTGPALTERAIFDAFQGAPVSDVVATPLDRGVLEEFAWSTWTWVPGLPLSEVARLLRGDATPLPEDVGIAIVDGLEALLSRISTVGVPGIVDELSPSRLLLDDDGTLRLLPPTWHASTTQAHSRRAIEAIGDAIAGGRPIRAEAGLNTSTTPWSAGEIASALETRLGSAWVQRQETHQRDLALARRLRARRKPQAPRAERVTANLRLRATPTTAVPPQLDAPPPPGMTLVSGGRFLFHGDEETPRLVEVAPFFMDIRPVSVGQFFRFCLRTRYPIPVSWPDAWRELTSDTVLSPALRAVPVVGISLRDATAFASWHGRRLPSEMEWEFAGRGPDGRQWPWGHQYEEGKLPDEWRKDWTSRGQPPIEASELANVSPFGVRLMCRAWEWTSSPALDLADDAWIVRGGAWRDHAEPPTLANRSFEGDAAGDVTFRCAADASPDVPSDPGVYVDDEPLTPSGE